MLVKETQGSNTHLDIGVKGRMNRSLAVWNWLRRTFTWYFSTKIALAFLVLAVSAVSITVTTTNYQAELGGAVKVTNKLVGIDKGFSKASSPASASGSSCANNVTFTTNPGTMATTAISSSDYVYDIQVANNTQTPTSTCYQVALTLTSSNGLQTTYGPLYIATTSTPLAWQPLDAKFDVGPNLPASPFSFLITIS
jgi:hypothetical protein